MIRRPFAPEAARLALDAADESDETTDDDRVFAAKVLASLLPRLGGDFMRGQVHTFLTLIQRIPPLRRPRDLQKVLSGASTRARRASSCRKAPPSHAKYPYTLTPERTRRTSG